MGGGMRHDKADRKQGANPAIGTPQAGSARDVAVGTKASKKRRYVRPAAKATLTVLAALLLLACAAVFFWRSAVIAVLGPGHYCRIVERQSLLPQLNAAAAQLSAEAPQYNSYDITENVSMNASNNTMAAAIGTAGLDSTKMFADSTFEVKLGKNTESKSMAAAFTWQYKGGKLVSGTAYMNSSKAVFHSPELLSENIFVNAGDIPELTPLFGICGQLSSQTGQKSDSSALLGGIKNAFTQADAAIKDRNVSIQRGITEKIDGKSIGCDKITVSLSADEVRSVLHKIFGTAGKNPTLKAFLQKCALWPVALYNLNEAGTSSPEVGYGVDDWSKAADGAGVSGVTMTMLVKNGLVGTQLLSGDIKTGAGDELVIASTDGFRSGTVEIKMKSQTEAPESDVKILFNNGGNKLSGTVMLPQNGESYEDAAVKLAFTADKTKKTSLGCSAMNLRLTASLDGNKTAITQDIFPDGNKTKLVTEYSLNDRLQTTMTAVVAGSSEKLAVPVFDPNNSINAVTDTQKLDAVQYELGQNLIDILNKLGVKPET